LHHDSSSLDIRPHLAITHKSSSEAVTSVPQFVETRVKTEVPMNYPDKVTTLVVGFAIQ